MFTNPSFRDVYPSIGGWTEHVSGLKQNSLVDSTRYFYGDLDTPNAPAYLRFLTSFSVVNQDRINTLPNGLKRILFPLQLWRPSPDSSDSLEKKLERLRK